MELYFLFLLILLMAVALGSGYPVAFALPGSAIITVGLAALCGYLFVGDASAFFIEGPHTWLSAGVTNFRGIYLVAERDTLIAIPLFIFMGIMLQKSRIAEDLLITMAQLFGPMPGGLGISVVLVGALLAATTGIVGATVVAMGLISLPAMLKNKYSHSLATGTICASGTLGQIIPPSIVLIILADQLSSAADQAGTIRKTLFKESTGDFIMPSAFNVISTSAGEMFLGALLPGLVLVGLYVSYIAILALIRPSVAPPVPYDGKYDWKFAGRVFMALVPPLALIFAVLGSIITGAANVNAAGSIGSAGALIMAGYRLYNGKSGKYWPLILAILSLIILLIVSNTHPIAIKKLVTSTDMFWFYITTVGVVGLVSALLWSGYRVLKIDNTLHEVMVETAKTTSLVFIILLGAAMLTSAFRGFGGEELVKDMLSGVPGGFWGQFLAVMLVIFVLGFFLDFIEIAVVVVPIVAPILLADPNANVTAVWLGVMIGLNIQTSFLTPPFGFALFYLRGVADSAVRTLSMYKGVVAFIGLQLVALVIVAYNPPLVNYLPHRISLTSETAPPPINPGIQYCLENIMLPKVMDQKTTILDAVTKARSLDLSTLPDDRKSDLVSSFTKVEKTFELITNVNTTVSAIDKMSVGYRPLHVKVRKIQKNIRDLKDEIKEVRNVRGERSEAAKAAAEKSIADLNARIKKLEEEIPANWKEDNRTFVKLLSKEKIARNLYRRNVDSAYEPLFETVSVISAYDKLKAQEAVIANIENVVNTKSFEEAAGHIDNLLPEFSKIAGAKNIRSAVYKISRALKGRDQSKEKALEELKTAQEILAKELTWRKAAKAGLLAKLQIYEQQIRNTIGLRIQPKIPYDIAVELAGCTSRHRDLTLRF